jgi:PadR family transcriptional regulator, regulatory protein PadR
MGRKVRKNDRLSGSLDMLILRTLSRRDLHGYGIVQFIQQSSDNELLLEEGTLYPALQRLELNGRIDGTWRLTSNHRRARIYQITSAGRKELTVETRKHAKHSLTIARVAGVVASACTPLTAWQGRVVAQGVSEYAPVSSACIELNKTVVTQAVNRHIDVAESLLSRWTASVDSREGSCVGFVLNNTAALMAISGRIAEAHAVAERSLQALEKIYSPNDPLLLAPLQILASTALEQGQITKAREALKRMQAIRVDRPKDSALIHGIAAALLHSEKRLAEAEVETLAALRAWEKAGRGETADAASVLISLGSIYIEEQRLDDASRTLDRALDTLNRAEDTVPLDRLRLLRVSAVLHARQGQWAESARDFADALSIADREANIDLGTLRTMLAGYAVVLRKIHHRHEARSIESRAASLRVDTAGTELVDITELLPKPKPAKK